MNKFYLDGAKLELVQHHCETSIQGSYGSFKVIQVTEKDQIEHLYKGEEGQEEYSKKT